MLADEAASRAASHISVLPTRTTQIVGKELTIPLKAVAVLSSNGTCQI
jgi:hypothetical protein